MAEYFFDRHQVAAHQALYHESVAAFDRAIELTTTPAAPVEIPGPDGISMPCYVFRPDSEIFLGAVVDHALEQPWVDPARIALYGLSLGGYHVLRAAARDQRVAAVVASAPMPDLFGMLVEAAVDGLPRSTQAPAHRLLTGLSPRALDRALALPRRLNWAVEVMVDGHLMWTTGAPTAGEGPAIRRRIERFQETIAGPSTLVALTPVDGADGHCGVGNVVHTAAIVCDWLDDTLGRTPMATSASASTSRPRTLDPGPSTPVLRPSSGQRASR